MVYVILVLLIVFLFFFCLYLYKKTKKLSSTVQELQVSLDIERNKKDIASVKFLSANKVPIKEISKDIEKAINECEKRKNKQEYYEEDRIDKILNTKDQPHHPYEKNILDTMQSTLSAIEIHYGINKEENNQKGDEVVMNEVDNKVNLNDFIKRGNYEIEQPEPPKKNISFVEEISKQLEQQLGPQTIELTDYEKEQEETAIISYKELLKVKEQLYEENAEKENEEFLNDLKAFRNNLG